jgi:NADPH-dependent F420 reductase
LALRLAQAGLEVLIGSRVEERAMDKAREFAAALRGAGLNPTLAGASNHEVVEKADLVFLSVRFPHVVESVRGLPFQAGGWVVDTSVPVVFEKGAARFVEAAEGSVSEQIQSALPEGVSLVAAFKTIPAHVLADLDMSLDCDLLVCSDDEAAKRATMRVASLIPGLRPLDAGSLREARTIERMAALAINLNLRYKRKSARFRVVGV